jgi:hypothetical protein
MNLRSLTSVLVLVYAAARLGAASSTAPTTGSTGPSTGGTGTSTGSPAPASISALLTPSGPQSLGSITQSLDWNETERVLSLQVQNPSPGIDMEIEGIQTTAGLYVVSFPGTIAKGATGTVTLLYEAPDALGATTETVNLKTSLGDKTIEVNVARSPAVSQNVKSLQWTEGDVVAAKAVQISVAASTVIPGDVQVTGAGNSAVLQNSGDGTYQLLVTPASTSKEEQFAVFVRYIPATAGVMTAVYCSVVSGN